MTEDPQHPAPDTSTGTAPAVDVPERPALEGLEDKWDRIWDEQGTYRFDRSAVESREQVFSIDTPPPTVSGSLHVGHVFSYTHTSRFARTEPR